MITGAGYTHPAAFKTKMYLWSSLYYHAILLTFYEIRDCHKQIIIIIKKSRNHNSEEIKKKNHKLSNSQQITILTFFNYMPLNDSEKDSKDSIVQSLDTPFM